MTGEKKKKVMCVFGTRPEVIKMAPVVHALQATDAIETLVCATSQHRHMQDQMMELFGIKADYDLAVMKPGQDLFYLSSQILISMQGVLMEAKPDLVLVHGDTTTSFIAALAAFYCHIPVGHVEAGLRTHNLKAPFPEEANRQLTGRITSIHFAPTLLAQQNLLAEQIAPEKVVVTGNTVIDALFWIRPRLRLEQIKKVIPASVIRVVEQGQPYVLITGHRRENFGAGFLSICEALKTLAEHYPAWHFIYPVHLNPQVQKPVFELLSSQNNIHLCDPVDYESFVYLMDHCHLVLTDSGGVQEEAPSLGKPVLVMRDVTERPEGIEAGTALLVGTDTQRIVQAVSELIDNPAAYQKMAQAVNPYGDGKAAQRIKDHVLQCLGATTMPLST